MKPPLVILDGHTTTPLEVGQHDSAQPDWAALEDLTALRVYPRTQPGEIVERARDYELVLTNKVVLDRKTLRQLPDLRYIGIMSTGTNVVDLETAAEQGITVTYVPAYSTPSVAQHTIALLLEIATHLRAHADLVRTGAWSSQPDFTVSAGPVLELERKRFGMLGCGAIGQATARIAEALGMEILVHSRTVREVDFRAHWVGEEELLEQSDVLSLHCPLTEETREWVNRDRLARLREGAILLNTSRGPLVDDEAVAEALAGGRLRAYGADVLTTEPPPADHPLLHAPNALITPHVGWASREARARLISQLASNVRAYLDGDPIHTVAP